MGSDGAEVGDGVGEDALLRLEEVEEVEVRGLQ